jgi:flagellar basal body rod protein FlgG
MHPTAAGGVHFLHARVAGAVMPKGVYIAASAMYVEATALDITARNLAHAQTTGYRREAFLRTGFAAEMAKQGHTEDLSGNGGGGLLASGSYFVQNGGSRETTGAPLDLAIEGDGFFKVQDDQGKALLTRAGHFVTDSQGRLATPEGWLVQGQGGAITLPPNAERISIDQQGRISAFVSNNGVRRDTVVDQVRLVQVEDPRALVATNGTYFDPGRQRQKDATGTVHQGFLEKSNVEPIQELAEMVAIQRRYDAAQKAMREMNQAGSGFSELLRGA